MKNVYKCGICGVEYPDVQSRMNCEMKCIKKQQEEEKAAAEAKLKAEKDTRRKEVTEAIDKAVDLIKKYNEDYKETFTYVVKDDANQDAYSKHKAFSRSCFWM
jgi:uncharacterized membrane-anchored protein YhcB (DUF1043 family)